jgi:hypothetical protein
VELEGVLRGDPGGLVGLRPLDHLGEQALALLERTAEALLLGARPALDGGPLAPHVGIDVAQDVAHAVAHLHQEGVGDAEHVALLDRPAHDAAEDVAAVLVRRDHAVREERGGASAVIRDHAQRARGREVIAVLPPGQLLTDPDQGREQVGLVHRRDVLHDARHPLEPHAGVDVLGGQLGQRPVRLELVLHEDEVPELEEALGVVARAVRVGAEVGAAVEVELGAGAARAGGARLPEVVVAVEEDDALVRNADCPPVVDRLLVRAEPELRVAAEDGDPDVLEAEPEAVLLVRGEVERELDRLLLEVLAHREVAEHLEEGEMPERQPDVLDVRGPERLLTGGQPATGRLLLTTKVRLERLHARRGEQNRGVIDTRNKRRRRNAQMPVPLEERQKPLANLARLHGLWSLGGRRCRPLRGAWRESAPPYT